MVFIASRNKGQARIQGCYITKPSKIPYSLSINIQDVSVPTTILFTGKGIYFLRVYNIYFLNTPNNNKKRALAESFL